jgi:hypothetical protein
MLANSVIAEGDRLAKPSMLLDETPSSSGVLAYWRGEGRVGYVGRVEDQHRITFDCAWLAQQGVRVNGCIGVYDVKNGWQVPLCVDRVQASLTEIEMKGGTPLYGHEAVSFPPLEAVCLYGGKPVEEWLASGAWIAQTTISPSTPSSARLIKGLTRSDARSMSMAQRQSSAGGTRFGRTMTIICRVKCVWYYGLFGKPSRGSRCLSARPTFPFEFALAEDDAEGLGDPRPDAIPSAATPRLQSRIPASLSSPPAQNKRAACRPLRNRR